MTGEGGVVRLGALTTEEAAARLGPGTALLLPVGSTEAHGPHLPLEADVIIAEETARRSARLLEAGNVPCLLLPALPYSLAHCARGYPGTVSVSAEAARGLLADLCRSLAPPGGPVLCLVNAHLEPEHLRVLRDVASEAAAAGCRVVFPDHTRRRHLEALGEEFLEGGGHAGGYETSLVLAAGGRVDAAVLATLPANRVNLAEQIRKGIDDFRTMGGARAYFGEPATASREEGERLYGILAAIVADAVRAALAPS